MLPIKRKTEPMIIKDLRAALRRPLTAAVAGLALLGAGVALAPGGSALAAGEAFSDAQKAELGGLIKDYLIKNPEVMIEVQRVLEAKMEAQRQEAAAKAVSENASSLYKNVGLPVAGDAKGDVTVVEFFDYNCGYCRKAVEPINKLIDGDKKVKVVMVDFPIFGKDSEGAARVAIAAGKQGKYWELHQALLRHKGANSEEVALQLGEKMGLDMAKLKADANSQATSKLMADNKALADKLGIQGTPHFYVGEKVIPGAPENLFDELTSLVGDVRKNGCKVC
jgi:protein-disulfide isomerase